MPRNTSGVYSLPQAAFIPNSIMSSAAVNSDFSDIAVALTGSLPIDGSAGMTGPFKVGSGNVGALGISFTSDTNTGFYLAGTHQIGWSANGVQQATFNSSGSVTWQGGATWGGAVTFNGASTLIGNVTFNATTYTFGAGAAAGFWAGIAQNVGIEVFMDGAGSVITAGNHGTVEVPFNCTITSWTATNNVSGGSNGISVDVWRANGALPTSSAQSIIGGSNFIGIGGGATYAHSAPAGSWASTSLLKGDILVFNVTIAIGVT